MIPTELIGTARVPRTPGQPGQSHEIAPGSELKLYRRGDVFSIRVDNWELMNSRSFGSEEELATLALEAARQTARVLVGGLGMGFTARAALDRMPSSASLVIAELVPEVVEWNRGPLGRAAGNPLEDPRTAVEVTDVRALIENGRTEYDAILLDVDNGPESGQTTAGEGWVHSPAGLAAAHRALRPGGVLAVWSAGDCPGFTRRLESAGFRVSEHESRGRGKKGFRHRIWVAGRR